MLRDLLELAGTPPPAVIVMADDKPGNLQAVVETFDSLGIPVRAWRYAREDGNVAAFDAAAAEALWDELEPHLRAMQELLGPENFQLPPVRQPGACGKPDTPPPR